MPFYKGAQYYGIMDMDYIDNDPCFLMIIDKGILYIYGMAKVNRRVVCSCLLSLEFTKPSLWYQRLLQHIVSDASVHYTFFTRKLKARLDGKTNDQTIKSIIS